MKQSAFPPRLELNDLRQAVRGAMRYAAPPAPHEEGYDPHPEHRDYELLKAEMRKLQDELARSRAHERELSESLETVKARPTTDTPTRTGWKRAIVLAEILGPPRGRRK